MKKLAILGALFGGLTLFAGSGTAQADHYCPSYGYGYSGYSGYSRYSPGYGYSSYRSPYRSYGGSYYRSRYPSYYGGRSYGLSRGGFGFSFSSGRHGHHHHHRSHRSHRRHHHH